jgi:ribosomal protein S18 acetylase RimI-like enzyme
MEIRLGKESDIDALVEFNLAMALETEGKTLTAATLRPGVQAVFDDTNKGFYVVADEGDSIIGGLLVTFEWSDWRNKWFWWIQSVYIRPDHRGRSLYRHMYEFVKDLADASGVVAGFRLYVEHDNEHAQRVYDKVGMQRSHYIMFEEDK